MYIHCHLYIIYIYIYMQTPPIIMRTPYIHMWGVHIICVVCIYYISAEMHNYVYEGCTYYMRGLHNYVYAESA